MWGVWSQHLFTFCQKTIPFSSLLLYLFPHLPLSIFPSPLLLSCSFPFISSHFISHLLALSPSSLSIFPHDLLLSPTPLLHRLTYFSNLHCVSQLKAFSSSYRPVVSLGTIRSALALGFCNSLTSSLPFLSSLWVFFSTPSPFCLFHLLSWSLHWTVCTWQNMV